MITTFLGMGKMGLHGLPVERVHLLNPGQRLAVGDRELVADAHFVAARFTVHGTHAGAVMGVGATGRRVSFDGMALYRMRDGRIAETWLHWTASQSSTRSVRRRRPEAGPATLGAGHPRRAPRPSRRRRGG